MSIIDQKAHLQIDSIQQNVIYLKNIVDHDVL